MFNKKEHDKQRRKIYYSNSKEGKKMREESKEYHKQYRIKNREKIRQKSKAWQQVYNSDTEQGRKMREEASQYHKKRRLANPKHFIELRKKYRLKNKNRIMRWGKKWRTHNPETYLLGCVKKRCKKHKIKFNLTKEDIVIPKHCPYLNIKLELYPKRKFYNSPSIDRIDNTKGYIAGNVQVVSAKANICKNDLTIPQLITFAENILRLHKNQ